MFNPNEMTIIHTSTECYNTAKAAEDDQQKKAVAYQINQAANCGEVRCEFLQELRPAVQGELTSKGYKLSLSGKADPKSSVIISWEKNV